MTDLDTLSILVHADSKVGKSTLGATCPTPSLIFDAEGSTKFLPIARTHWDPTREEPPVNDGTWTHCIVTVRDLSSIHSAYAWLNSGRHPFRSVVMDSISEIQRKVKTSLVGTEQMKIQHWGELLTQMDSLVRGYRDLTLHPTNPVAVAMFISESREKNGRWKPYMQGQIEIALPYWMDIVGHLRVEQIPTADGGITSQRQLLIGPHPQFEAGERVQGRLPHLIAEPNITAMYMAVYPHTQGVPAS